MRNVFFVLLQFVLFLVTFLIGSLFLHPFHVQTTLASDATHVRLFQWDGVLLMTLLFFLALLLEALRKKFRRTAPGTTLAVTLAAVAGLMMRFGFVNIDR